MQWLVLQSESRSGNEGNWKGTNGHKEGPVGGPVGGTKWNMGENVEKM